VFANDDHPLAVYERTVAEHDEDMVTWACQMGERPPVLREERVLYSPACAACLIVYDVHQRMYDSRRTAALSYDGKVVETADIDDFEKDRDDKHL
jgi:hypothetical protein